MSRTAFDSTFCDYAKWRVKEFVAEDPVMIKGSFLCDVVQNFTAYFAEVFDANETDLTKSATHPIPVKAGFIFGHVAIKVQNTTIVAIVLKSSDALSFSPKFRFFW